MKIDIKCYEFLTNKGNGKKCILGPKDCKHLPNCVFKINGIIESWDIERKKKYIHSLATKCKSWHERKNERYHFFNKIEPQLESIYIKINSEQNKQKIKKLKAVKIKT